MNVGPRARSAVRCWGGGRRPGAVGRPAGGGPGKRVRAGVGEERLHRAGAGSAGGSWIGAAGRVAESTGMAPVAVPLGSAPGAVAGSSGVAGTVAGSSGVAGTVAGRGEGPL
ncbi:hypothetical protein GA0115251_10769 [Streptomyces sp. TverLS-915]|nr:hypothetical protein GA0115251_10769 [Streptomyces sp. TverLS-915]